VSEVAPKRCPGGPVPRLISDNRMTSHLPVVARRRAQASTPLRFQGQHEDAETGLFYNRFRYYDPDAGLYLSPDPIGLEGGLRPYGTDSTRSRGSTLSGWSSHGSISATR
jgi:RHS repeat-associated protein